MYGLTGHHYDRFAPLNNLIRRILKVCLVISADYSCFPQTLQQLSIVKPARKHAPAGSRWCAAIGNKGQQCKGKPLIILPPAEQEDIMPKKFKGENSKAAAARERKQTVKQEADDRKRQAEEDAYWKDDDKHAQRRQDRRVNCT